MDTVSDYRRLQTLTDSVLLYMLSIISNHLCAYKVTCAVWSSKATHLSHTPVIHPFSFPLLSIAAKHHDQTQLGQGRDSMSLSTLLSIFRQIKAGT